MSLVFVIVIVIISLLVMVVWLRFFFQAEDGIRDGHVTGVQTCALPISICKIPHKNPPTKLAKNPQRKAMIKIGTIASEMDIDGIGLMEGKKSNNIASAAKIDTSIIACKLNFFPIKKSPPKDV